MNIYDEHPFKVIVDYGHNAAAVEVMCELVKRLDVQGRRLCVLAAPGDRRDQDVADIGRIAAGHFDHYICRRDDQLRGRRPEEVPQLLRDALVANGVPPDHVEMIPDEQTAVDTALRRAEAGDLLLIFADAITRTWKQVIQFRPDATSRPFERMRVSQPELAAVLSHDGLEDHRREFVRDSRGVRLAREESED
jgi:cyanophycin synthetase